MSFMKTAVLTLALLVTCAQAQQAPHNPQKPAEPRVPLRNLNEMIEKARTDLAMRLGGKPTEITVAGWTSVHLPARVLRCEVTKGDEGEPTVPGYRIVLVLKARDYTYYSDTQTVSAC